MEHLEDFQINQLKLCKALNLKGRVLLGKEGINGNLTGIERDIAKYKDNLQSDIRFSDMKFKEGNTSKHNFKKMFVRIRKEIVTTGFEVNTKNRADYIEPNELKAALDKKDDLILLDVRNNYEFKIGKFQNAVTPNIKTFRDFPNKISQLIKYKNKNIVTYCTGGVRCEKASALLIKNGFTQVRQLHGGIINYGKICSNHHWEGKCFVFDTRGAIELDPSKPTHPITQCTLCNLPCDTYHNCGLTSCDKRFISCNNCLKTLNNCCSKLCRNEYKLTCKSQNKSFYISTNT